MLAVQQQELKVKAEIKMLAKKGLRMRGAGEPGVGETVAADGEAVPAMEAGRRRSRKGRKGGKGTRRSRKLFGMF